MAIDEKTKKSAPDRLPVFLDTTNLICVVDEVRYAFERRFLGTR